MSTLVDNKSWDIENSTRWKIFLKELTNGKYRVTWLEFQVNGFRPLRLEKVLRTDYSDLEEAQNEFNRKVSHIEFSTD